MLNYSILPPNLQEGMRRYIEEGILPGDFLQACLANDFVMVLRRASPKTYDYVDSIAMFLYTELPARSSPDCPWGSREAIDRHIQRVRERRRPSTQMVPPILKRSWCEECRSDSCEPVRTYQEKRIWRCLLCRREHEADEIVP